MKDNMENAGLTVAAKVENKRLIEDLINERLEKAGCPIDLGIKFAVVIDEIFSNIVYYAYEGRSGDVTVSLDIGADLVKLTFVDEGVSFDPLSWPEPDVTKGADEREIGGLGIFMVKKLMDEVAYEHRDGKNIFTAMKRY